MQTPEELARLIADECVEGYYDRFYLEDAVDLIRARDEEVRADERAKVLAGFEVERADRMVARRVPCDCPGDWQHHGRFVGDDGPEMHARFDVVPSRRLVGPWQPVADEGGAS